VLAELEIWINVFPERSTRRGVPEVDARDSGTKHAAAPCLLGLHERANGTALDGEGIQAWLEWEATHWRVPVDIFRAELEGLVERSAGLLKMPRYSTLHGSDWALLPLRGTAKPRRSGSSTVLFMHRGASLSGPPRCCVTSYAFHGVVKPPGWSWGSNMQNPVCGLRGIYLPRTRVNSPGSGPYGGCAGPARMCTVGGIGEEAKRKGRWRMRVLVAYEEAHRSYREAIVRAIGQHRPRFTVLGTTPGALGTALERFEPHAVVSSRPSAEYPGGGRGAWVELPAEPSRGGEVCVGGDREGANNPGLGRVLGALDEAEERLRRGALAGGC
jgi:hypothetical protein